LVFDKLQTDPEEEIPVEESLKMIPFLGARVARVLLTTSPMGANWSVMNRSSFVPK
jgi:hypothetical protein